MCVRSLRIGMTLALLLTATVGCKTETRTTSVPPGQQVTVSRGEPRSEVRATDPGAPRHQPQVVAVQPLPGAADALVGKLVRISFRRDALGLAANSIPEPDAEMITGRPVQLTGTVA